MSLAGIAPSSNLPPGTAHEPVAERDDAGHDLERMLAPLRVLPGLVGLRRDARDYCENGCDQYAPIEVSLELELDRAAPHLDLVRQLLALLRRVIEHRGVVLNAEPIQSLESIAAPARQMRSAWESTSRASQ